MLIQEILKWLEIVVPSDRTPTIRHGIELAQSLGVSNSSLCVCMCTIRPHAAVAFLPCKSYERQAAVLILLPHAGITGSDLWVSPMGRSNSCVGAACNPFRLGGCCRSIQHSRWRMELFKRKRRVLQRSSVTELRELFGNANVQTLNQIFMHSHPRQYSRFLHGVRRERGLDLARLHNEVGDVANKVRQLVV